MRKFALPLAMLAVVALPFGAFGASVGVNTTTTAATTAGVANSSATANSATTINGTLSAGSNFSDVMGTLSAPATSAAVDLTTIHPKHIKFVLVSKLNGYSATGLKVPKANLENMTALDAKVAADAALSAALKRSGYAPSNVVAVSTDAKGDLIVFIA